MDSVDAQENSVSPSGEDVIWTEKTMRERYCGEVTAGGDNY